VVARLCKVSVRRLHDAKASLEQHGQSIGPGDKVFVPVVVTRDADAVVLGSHSFGDAAADHPGSAARGGLRPERLRRRWGRRWRKGRQARRIRRWREGCISIASCSAVECVRADGAAGRHVDEGQRRTAFERRAAERSQAVGQRDLDERRAIVERAILKPFDAIGHRHVAVGIGRVQAAPEHARGAEQEEEQEKYELVDH